MKRIVSAACAALVLVASLVIAAPASAWDSGNANGTQPVMSGENWGNCAIRESGAIYCWGTNGSGELGRGTGTAASTAVAPVSSYRSSLALSVSENSATVCAVMLDRTVKCWGYGSTGMVGNGATSAAVDTPTPVSGLTRVATVSVGFGAVCASRQDGSVWCWGTPTWGTFSGFPAGLQTTPVKVAGLSNITDVSVSEHHACALRVDHHVVCWGANNAGQLGDGTHSVRTGLVVVPGISDATAVVAGDDNTCVLRTGGTAYCWGLNSGEVALGARTSVADSAVPLKVYGVSGASTLAFQGYGGCVLAGGLVKCWGNGFAGRLGDGQIVDQSSPVRATVATLPKPTAVWTSYWGSCEIGDGGRVWCWGDNTYGRLGNGTTASAPLGAGPGDTFGYADTPSKVTLLDSAPGKPAGSSKASKSIKITWSAPSSSNGASAPTDYVIKYKLKGTSTWKTYSDTVSATRSVTVKGLKSGKYYQFIVYPKNWAGTGSGSSASSYIKSK